MYVHWCTLLYTIHSSGLGWDLFRKWLLFIFVWSFSAQCPLNDLPHPDWRSKTELHKSRPTWPLYYYTISLDHSRSFQCCFYSNRQLPPIRTEATWSVWSKNRPLTVTRVPPSKLPSEGDTPVTSGKQTVQTLHLNIRLLWNKIASSGGFLPAYVWNMESLFEAETV